MKNFLNKTTFLPLCAALALTACSNESTTGDTDKGEIRVSGRLTGDAPEASYNHSLALYKDGAFVETKTGANAAFTLAAGDNVYLWAAATSNGNADVSMIEADGVGLIQLTDLTDVPDILIGKSDEATVSATQSLPIEMNRLVSKLAFKITAPASVSAITATVQNVNDKISNMNKKGIASAEGLTQTVVLAKDAADGLFKGNTLIAPSGAAATNFDVAFEATYTDGTASGTKTFTGVLNANEETLVTANLTIGGGGTVDVEVTADISYETWGTNTTVNDNVDLTPDESAFDVVTFEGIDPSYLAGPTSYGENLYSGYDPQYIGYWDEGTDLFMGVNESYGSPNFFGGGVAISQWNEMTTAGYTNQCSVYYSDPENGFGGHGGSETFAVGYGYYDLEPTAVSFDARPSVYFLTEGTERVFDHVYVTNNTYAVLSMEGGDQFGKTFSYADQDWFKLIATGYDKNGTETASVELYLADFRTPEAPGITKEWVKFDLSPLKAVHKIVFNVASSDAGQYGMNTPAYFCMDDLAIRK